MSDKQNETAKEIAAGLFESERAVLRQACRAIAEQETFTGIMSPVRASLIGAGLAVSVGCYLEATELGRAVCEELSAGRCPCGLELEDECDPTCYSHPDHPDNRQSQTVEPFVHIMPSPMKCEHDFTGWRDFADGSGCEQTCCKCGVGAMGASLRAADEWEERKPR